MVGHCTNTHCAVPKVPGIVAKNSSQEKIFLRDPLDNLLESWNHEHCTEHVFSLLYSFTRFTCVKGFELMAPQLPSSSQFNVYFLPFSQGVRDIRYAEITSTVQKELSGPISKT